MATSRSLIASNLVLPNDFPVAEYDSAELHFRTRPASDARAEFTSAWLAVAYRFMDTATYDEGLRRSIAAIGTAPPQATDRYEQERYLFGFFVAGLSVIESVCYGLCALAWEASPTLVSLATDNEKRGVNPQSTCQRFEAHFASDAVTVSLRALIDSPEFDEWGRIRNLLAHRVAPPRKHHLMLGNSGAAPPLTSEWAGLPLDTSTTSTRRRWLTNELAALLGGAGFFAHAHF